MTGVKLFITKPERRSVITAGSKLRHRVFIPTTLPFIHHGIGVKRKETLMPLPHFNRRVILPSVPRCGEGLKNLVSFNSLFTKTSPVKTLSS